MDTEDVELALDLARRFVREAAPSERVAEMPRDEFTSYVVGGVLAGAPFLPQWTPDFAREAEQILRDPGTRLYARARGWLRGVRNHSTTAEPRSPDDGPSGVRTETDSPGRAVKAGARGSHRRTKAAAKARSEAKAKVHAKGSARSKLRSRAKAKGKAKAARRGGPRSR